VTAGQQEVGGSYENVALRGDELATQEPGHGGNKLDSV